MADLLRDRLQSSLGSSLTLERELGGGGMSRVFVAEDAALGRRIVVKVLAPELAEELSAERFAREIRLAARLQHPNIVPVLSAGVADGVPYYVMPYVDGDSLRVRLRAGHLARPEAASILRDVAKALAYAHRRGVVHRDIKPENVLLADGTAVVTDFGVAKAVSDATTRTAAADGASVDALTRLGAVVGTPAYMAPEQAAGDPHVDHRADVYAWGLLAYELLAGRHPFAERRSAHALAVAHLTEAPPALAACAPTVPPALADLVMRCLAKDPVERPADAPALLSLFEGALGALDVTPPAYRAAPAARPAVGVLPFANLSSDPENEYLSDGLTDEIIGTLGRMRGVRVAGRASCFALKGLSLDPRTVGERLSVTAVVEGSVRRAGNRVRVQAELVNAADGYQLWGERYDRELTDIFAVQEEIAQAIAGALSEHLTSTGGAANDAAARPGAPASPEAYRLYLQGVHALNNDLTAAGTERALRALERALALDPHLARAQTAVARAYSNFAVYSLRPPHAVMPRAGDAARAALAVDEREPEAHLYLAQLAYAYEWDWAVAERGFARALALGPDDPVVLVRTALFRGGAGRVDDVLPLLRRALEVDPLSPWVRFVAGRTLHLLRRYDEAADVLRDALELNPHHAYALFTLGCVLMALGRLDPALQALERAAALSERGPWMLAPLCQLQVARGERAAAETYAAELLRRRSGEYVSGVLCAFALAPLGRMDEAIHELSRAVEERDFWLSMLGVDPLADALRGDPRFEAVLRAVGVPRA